MSPDRICRVDIGDAPYAANVHIDGQGRALLWLWLRDPQPEHLPPSGRCGCLALPRVLTYVEDRASPNRQHGIRPCPVLFQQPLPELACLRSAQIRTSTQLDVQDGDCVPLVHMPHAHCNVEATLHRYIFCERRVHPSFYTGLRSCTSALMIRKSAVQDKRTSYRHHGGASACGELPPGMGGLGSR